MGVSVSDPIIIVGTSAFGLSTALHLSQRGYTNVSVFDKKVTGDLTVYHATQDAGVQFFLGQPVDEIAYVSTLTGRKAVGIRTRDRFYPSSLVILDLGARDRDARSGIGHTDSLATPLSWYSNPNSLAEYVPYESASVILLEGDSKRDSKKAALVGSLVLDLMATSDQRIAMEVSEIVPQILSRL
ncbi:hypothetical protein N7457_002782 [Penicillium paradoxum]|uniref:uncharacterized protein n=1 Tax=Penicillium paradoxum TaxID=176176 RepID=UPI0025480AC9|nr:uncharacterized protein N7457_002782 [Penicillium paradoxum]KAJ5787792.1 hypothetical protein N7457_002782 [Penicillium paradoxum]